MSEATKILFVEDSKDLLSAWETMLSRHSCYEVKAVDQGVIAFQIVAEGFQPDILVTDYYLGDCTGVELMRRIRHYVPEVQVVVMTGDSENESLHKMNESGEIELLIKPVKFQLLHDAIQKKRLASPVSSKHKTSLSTSCR